MEQNKDLERKDEAHEGLGGGERWAMITVPSQ
jgi:hypothetical protein